MDTFTYKDDVAPLKGDFFPENKPAPLTGASLDEALYLSQRYGNEIQREVDLLNQQEDRARRNKMQDLTYANQRMRLEEARKKSAMELDLNEMVPSALKSIDDIIQSDLSPMEMQEKLLDERTKNPKVFALNPLAEEAFKNANARVGMRINKQERDEAKARDAENRIYSRIRPWIASGQVDIVQRLMDRKGIESTAEKDYLFATQKVAETAKQDKLAKKSQENLASTLDSEGKFIDSAYKTLDSLTDIKGDSDEEFMKFLARIESGDGISEAESENEVFSPKSRRSLIMLLSRLNGKTPSQMRGFKDVDLYDSALAALAQRNSAYLKFSGNMADKPQTRTPTTRTTSSFFQ